MTKKDPRKLILEVLRNHPEGLTITSIANMTGLHRHTSTKYIHELIGADMVFQRRIGVAKLCYLSKKVSKKSKEKKMLESLEKRRFGSKFKMRVIVAVVLLSFLLSGTVIWASQNVSLLNETNLSTFNTSPMTASANSNVSPQISQIINQTFIENATEPNETSSINEPLENNQTVENTENYTFEPVLEPLVLNNVDTFEKFLIEFSYPEKIKRGEPIVVKATVKNTDSVPFNVRLEWIVPNGFVVDENTKICGVVEPSEVCESEIIVKTDFSTLLGLNEVKIVVNYEE
jgi:predicted transcriptional regulator